jgi:hypothetical protein
MVIGNVNQSGKKGVGHACIDGRISEISDILFTTTIACIDGTISKIRG